MRPSVCYVATYDPDYARNSDLIRLLRCAGARVEVVRGSRQVATYSSSPGGVRDIAAAVRYALRLVANLFLVSLRLTRCRILVIGYLGQLDALALIPIARLMGRRIVFSPLVTLTETMVDDRSLVRAGGFAAWLLRKVDRRVLRGADVVIVDTPEQASYATDISGRRPEDIVVLPVGVDENWFYPSKRQGEGSDGTFNVLFYGTFIPLHGVETIVRAAGLLSTSDPDVRFELVGRGQEYAKARQVARECGADNILWTDWLPYSDLGCRIRDADVVLGVFDSGSKAARVIPNKVYQALACAVPVVTRQSPAVSRLVVDRTSAMLVAPGDWVALASTLRELRNDAELRKRIGDAGRVAWEHHGSPTSRQSIVARMLNDLGER